MNLLFVHMLSNRPVLPCVKGTGPRPDGRSVPHTVNWWARPVPDDLALVHAVSAQTKRPQCDLPDSLESPTVLSSSQAH
jgi:hypothetical protein